MTFPEIFMVQRAGVMLEYNGPTWYLSAMFLSMWLLVYILYKHKDFFMYILAPLLAVFMLGFMYQTNNRHLAGHATFYGIVLGAIIRAICGLCFGVVAWLINEKLKKLVKKKSQMILLTILEIFIWGVFFSAWLIDGEARVVMSVLFILPIGVAISFSRKSYVYLLFGFGWMKYLAPISLAIYFNHWIARYAVMQVFPECSYKFGLSMMILFTAVVCLIYYVIMNLCRLLWNKRLKKVFSNEEG